MALPTSGLITMAQVNTELGYASNAYITLNDTAVRTLAGVASGSISMSNLHGKSSEPPMGVWYYSLTEPSFRVVFDSWSAPSNRSAYVISYNGTSIVGGTLLQDGGGRTYIEVNGFRYTRGLTVMYTDVDDYDYYKICKTSAGIGAPTET